MSTYAVTMHKSGHTFNVMVSAANENAALAAANEQAADDWSASDVKRVS